MIMLNILIVQLNDSNLNTRKAWKAMGRARVDHSGNSIYCDGGYRGPFSGQEWPSWPGDKECISELHGWLTTYNRNIRSHGRIATFYVLAEEVRHGGCWNDFPKRGIAEADLESMSSVPKLRVSNVSWSLVGHFIKIDWALRVEYLAITARCNLSLFRRKRRKRRREKNDQKKKAKGSESSAAVADGKFPAKSAAGAWFAGVTGCRR